MLIWCRLEFGTVQDARPGSGERAKTPSQVQHSNDVIAMLSPDGERVALSKGLKARGELTLYIISLSDFVLDFNLAVRLCSFSFFLFL